MTFRTTGWTRGWTTPVRARACQAVPVAFAVGAGVVVGLVPMGTESTEQATSTGAHLVAQHSTRLLDEMGRGLIPIVVIPVLLTLLPLLTTGPAHRIVSTVSAAALGGLCALAMLTIGVFYAPAALALAAGAVFSWTDGPGRGPHRA